MVPEGVKESRFQPAGNDDSITGEGGSINSPYHVLVVSLKLSPVVNWDGTLMEAHCTSKYNISGF